MRKPFVTTGMLFIGLIVVLGAIGIANGLWSKNLVINGTVTTGDLNADWDCAYTNDDNVNFTPPSTGPCAGLAVETGDTGLDPHGSFPPFPYSDPFVPKDVAECNVRIETTEDTVYGAQIADVNIHNAYPSYQCTFTLALSNTGSIPFNFAGAAPIDLPTQLEFLDNGCSFPTSPNLQIDPAEEALVSCTVHVKEIAAQNTCTGTTDTTSGHVVVTENCGTGTLVTYSFHLKVCVAQWNETATYSDCTGSAQHEGPPDPFSTL